MRLFLSSSLRRLGTVALLSILVPLSAVAAKSADTRPVVHVGPEPDARFHTVAEALASATGGGLIVLIAPGTYKEKLLVTQGNVTLVGTGRTPADTVLTFDDSAKSAGGTSKSATLTVLADGFAAENLSIVNTWWDEHPDPADASQAVALQLRSDRAVIDRVRLISGQDTLYAASRTCHDDTSGTPCAASREFFNDCTIEGHVDFIFGDAKAVFDHCDLHARPHPTVMLTAQSRHYPAEDSGYWMLHCRITGNATGDRVLLGRPWRAYATVTFFDTDMEQAVAPEGWSDWDGRLSTATYREYGSHGPGFRGAQRIVTSPPLSPAERAAMTPNHILAGGDDWQPEAAVRGLRRLVPHHHHLRL